MSISITKYLVKRGDTLQSVSSQLGLSPEALKRYHNTYCDLKNLIGHDLVGLKEILIPPQDKIAEYKAKDQIIAVSNELPYHLKDLYATAYIVTEQIGKQNQQKINLRYHANINLRSVSETGWIAEIKNKGFVKNNKYVDDKVSALSLACIECIYPIALKLQPTGKVQEIYEHKNLIKRFENKKQDLQEEFIGEVSEKYIEQFEKSLKDEKNLARQLSSTLFYQIFFPNIEWFRKKSEWEEGFYILPNKHLVKCKFKIAQNHEQEESVETLLTGQLVDKISLQQLLLGKKPNEDKKREPASGTIEIRYTTHKITKQLLKAEATVILLHHEEVYHQHSLTFKAKKEQQPKRKLNTLVE